jgi:hypothetical protein
MNLAEQATRAQITNIFAKLKAGKTISKREQQQVEAFETAKELPLSYRDKAKHFRISHVAFLKWGKNGCPIDGTLEEIDKWRIAKGKESVGSVLDAKLRKTLLEVERLEIMNSQIRGELMKKVEVREAGVAIGAILSAECSAMVNDLPGQIAGQDEVEIRPKLQSRIDLLLTNIRTKLNESAE